MRLLHLGDLHIGKIVNEFNMIEDQKYMLDKVVELCVERKIDGVLIAGDVYDRKIPPEEAVDVFDTFLNNLVNVGKKVYIISGNHDSDERLNFGSQLFKKNNVYICAKYKGEIMHITEEDEEGKLNIYLLPFVKASIVRNFFDENIENYEDAIRVAIAHTPVDTNERNVLVAHQFVAGKSADPVVSGSESAGTRNVGNVERIGVDVFKMFDYVALGHIHRPQKIDREEVRYSGSLLKYSLSETQHNKSFPVVTFGKKGNIDIDYVSIKPLRDMRKIVGKLDVLLSDENVTDSEDYMHVVLTDEEPRENIMSIIQTKYPNAMKVEYQNLHSGETDNVLIDDEQEEKSFVKTIEEFYFKMFQTEISDDEMKIMKEAAKEAGIIDEAD